MKKRALALVLCLMLVLTVFAGCTPSEPTPGGNDNPPSGSDNQGGDTQGGAQAGEGEFAAGLTGTYKIMVAGEQAEDTIDPVTGGTIKGWKTIASEFVNQNPGVELQFVEVPWTDYIAKLQTAAQSGEFDVLHLAAGQNATAGNNGYLVSLNEYIEKDEKFDGEALYGKELWNSSNIYTDGNWYGLPKLGYTFMHLYNKQILDDFGVTDYPDINDCTWEEILEIAKQCTGVNPRTGKQTYGLFVNKGTTSFIELCNYFAKDGSFYSKWDVDSGFTGDIGKIEFTIAGNEAIKKALNWLKEAANYMPAGWLTGEGTENFFTEDSDVAMWMDTDGAGMPKALFDNGDLELLSNYIFFKVPAYEDASRGGAISRSSGNFHTWGIPLSAKDPDASWEIVKFLGSEYVSKIAYDEKWLTPVFPSAKEWIVPEDTLSIPCIEGLSETYEYPKISKTSGYSTYNNLMADLFANYCTGGISESELDGRLEQIQKDMEAWRDNCVKNGTR